MLSKECDLSNLRSRIKTEDAQHVVCSMHLLKEYLTSLLKSSSLPAEEASQTPEEIKATTELVETASEMEQMDVFDKPEEDIFSKLATNLARSFDAPIALITGRDGHRCFWEAQCGLGDDWAATVESAWASSRCSRAVLSDSTLVLADTADDECFANDAFLKDKGVRFYAGAPLKTHEGDVIGSLCVLDTRPRQITEQQRELLTSIADAVMTAIELHHTAQTAQI